jgi:hypothetical protein
MEHLAVLLAPQTAMRLTAGVAPHREPPHPAVIPQRFGKGQGLAHLALVPETTGAVVTLDPAGVDVRVPQPLPHMRKRGCPMNGTHCNASDSTTFVALVDLPIGQPLVPANDRTLAAPSRWITRSLASCTQATVCS